MSDKDELVERLCELEGKIKYHFITGDSIEYCDERSCVLLEVSEYLRNTQKNVVAWLFHFIESDESYIYTQSEIENGLSLTNPNKLIKN